MTTDAAARIAHMRRTRIALVAERADLLARGKNGRPLTAVNGRITAIDAELRHTARTGR